MQRSRLLNLMTTTVFTIVDLVAGRVKLLENGDTEEFNSLRKEFKHQTTKYSLNERVDLYINLNGVNLESLMILHSNLSNTDLENSALDNVQVSGDLSNINLRNASLKQLTDFGNNFCLY
jgi:uncharacterized protein YjbI with pentapeptide repeats